LKTLYHCASYASKIKKDIEFIVIGTTANNNLFKKLSNVTIYGAYKPEELNELISKSKLDFAAFFSTRPETYCYTLSEALENGLYPFAFDIGAVGERVRQLGVGYLIEPNINVASLVEALSSFASQCRQQEDTVNIGNHYSESFLNSYYLFQI
ncbi:MAG: glycosyltransferase family 4 protein, partial [Okeania sp. SIO2D1]|nr:glycosyltransferase family 4 protein [Okeania sp. SIO2D1]